MDTKLLNELNRRLGDIRGRNPHNDPIYRWIHSRDLRYPLDLGGGFYEMARQIEDDRWVVAMWQPPMPEDQWKSQFPSIGYPHKGMYYATDLMLKVGQEPTDFTTDTVAGYIKAHGCKKMRDFIEEVKDARERRERAQKSVISDRIDDACVAFNHVPGRRGDHVSFGGIDADKTTN